MPQVVALGNLLPENVATDELDSWMFQTVGHTLVEAYAAATGLPLLRRRIRGASRHTVSSCCNLVVQFNTYADRGVGAAALGQRRRICDA